MFHSLKSFIPFTLFMLLSVGNAQLFLAHETIPPSEAHPTTQEEPPIPKQDHAFQSKSIFTLGTHAIHAAWLGFSL